MDANASPAGLPELKQILGTFRVRFRRPEGAEALERYMGFPQNWNKKRRSSAMG